MNQKAEDVIDRPRKDYRGKEGQALAAVEDEASEYQETILKCKISS